MNMKKIEKRQTGFSLIEVLFAVMILSMGLIFVAAQFPVGLMASKETAEATLNAINSHNAEIMTELEIKAAEKRLTLISGNLDQTLDRGDTSVHPLVTPNVFADSVEVTIDDPENYEYHIIANPTKDPEWIFWSRTKTNPYNYLPNKYENTSIKFIGDIGPIMCPAVDESDPRVIEIINQSTSTYNPMDATDRVDYLHPALFDVAMTRNYCWKALYQRHFTTSNEYTFYIFTLRCPNKSLRYALQQYTGSNPAVLKPEALSNTDSTTDRRFPVPWLIDLTVTRYTATNNALKDDDRFWIHSEISAIVRPGSYIVDAVNGYLYEVLEITVDNNGDEWLRLRTPLEVNLQQFWVFPPAIEDFPYFAEQQPVMQVTQKIVRF